MLIITFQSQNSDNDNPPACRHAWVTRTSPRNVGELPRLDAELMNYRELGAAIGEAAARGEVCAAAWLDTELTGAGKYGYNYEEDDVQVVRREGGWRKAADALRVLELAGYDQGYQRHLLDVLAFRARALGADWGAVQRAASAQGEAEREASRADAAERRRAEAADAAALAAEACRQLREMLAKARSEAQQLQEQLQQTGAHRDELVRRVGELHWERYAAHGRAKEWHDRAMVAEQRERDAASKHAAELNGWKSRALEAERVVEMRQAADRAADRAAGRDKAMTDEGML